jgi:hypothetical protein
MARAGPIDLDFGDIKEGLFFNPNIPRMSRSSLLQVFQACGGKMFFGA